MILRGHLIKRLALIAILEAVVLGIPVAFMTVENPPVYAVIVSTFGFIVAMSLLMLMFVPKVILVRKKAQEKAEKEQDTERRNSPSSSSEAESGIRITNLGPMLQTGVSYICYLTTIFLFAPTDLILMTYCPT